MEEDHALPSRHNPLFLQTIAEILNRKNVSQNDTTVVSEEERNGAQISDDILPNEEVDLETLDPDYQLAIMMSYDEATPFSVPAPVPPPLPILTCDNNGLVISKSTEPIRPQCEGNDSTTDIVNAIKKGVKLKKPTEKAPNDGSSLTSNILPAQTAAFKKIPPRENGIKNIVGMDLELAAILERKRLLSETKESFTNSANDFKDVDTIANQSVHTSSQIQHKPPDFLPLSCNTSNEKETCMPKISIKSHIQEVPSSSSNKPNGTLKTTPPRKNVIENIMDPQLPAILERKRLLSEEPKEFCTYPANGKKIYDDTCIKENVPAQINVNCPGVLEPSCSTNTKKVAYVPNISVKTSIQEESEIKPNAQQQNITSNDPLPPKYVEEVPAQDNVVEEESWTTDIDSKIKTTELKLKKKKIARRNRNKGKADDDADLTAESEVDLELDLEDLKQLKKKRLLKKTKTKLDTKTDIKTDKSKAPPCIDAQTSSNNTVTTKAVGKSSPQQKNIITGYQSITNIAETSAAGEVANFVPTRRPPKKSQSFNANLRFIPPVTEKGADGDELKAKLTRRLSMNECGRDNISPKLQAYKADNQEHLKEALQGDNKLPNVIEENKSLPSVEPISKTQSQETPKISLDSKKPIPYPKVAHKKAIPPKMPTPLLNTISDTIVASGSNKKETSSTVIPAPPPFPMDSQIDAPLQNGNQSYNVPARNDPPASNSSLGIQEKFEKEIDDEVEPHALLLKEIITGIKLRSIIKDPLQRRVGSGCRASQDLESILAKAITLRNHVMNPDSDSEDSGNDDDVNFDWDEESETSIS